MYEQNNETQKDKKVKDSSFAKSILQGAVQEIKAISASAVAVVLVCALISVMGIGLCVSGAENNRLAKDKAGLSDKLSEKENQITELEDSLDEAQKDAAQKDEVIQNQQETIENNEIEKEQLADELKDKIDNLDLTGSAASRSDSDINSVKNSISDTELLIRDYFGYSETANELVAALHEKADAFQDKLDRYPDFYPTEGGVGSPFGYRKDPINGTTKFHTGIDLGSFTGTPIFAAAKGEVTYVGFEKGYGLYVLIDHGDGYESKYAHLDEAFVEVGDIVEKGDHIAAMGATGRVTGPHLHFEIVLNGEFQNPADYIL